MAMSDYLEEKLLNATLRGESYTSPSTVYIALYTSNPKDDDTGVEISSAGYERKQITFTTPIQEGGKATVVNNTMIEFPPVTGGYGVISHVGIRDAKTGGNLLYYAGLLAPIDASSDHIGIRLNIGELKIGIE